MNRDLRAGRIDRRRAPPSRGSAA